MTATLDEIPGPLTPPLRQIIDRGIGHDSSCSASVYGASFHVARMLGGASSMRAVPIRRSR